MHCVNRPSPQQSIANWPTTFLLPADGTVFFENASILVKLR